MKGLTSLGYVEGVCVERGGCTCGHLGMIIDEQFSATLVCVFCGITNFDS